MIQSHSISITTAELFCLGMRHHGEGLPVAECSGIEVKTAENVELVGKVGALERTTYKEGLNMTALG